MNKNNAVKAWRNFANSTMVTWQGHQRSWAEHLRRGGFSDEESLVQPRIFPLFAEQLLGYEVGVNLAAEQSDIEGKPDFVPADAVTHPFVFETKNTSGGHNLYGHHEQVLRYLTAGLPRIRRVVLTNVAGIVIYTLDSKKELIVDYTVNLEGLLVGTEADALKFQDANRLYQFITDFSFQQLTPERQVQRLREQPEWNPLLEVTDSKWISARLDKVVSKLVDDVSNHIQQDILNDPSVVSPDQRQKILLELRMLEWDHAVSDPDLSKRAIADYVYAKPKTAPGKAFAQYVAHVAYFAASQILLVRIWEDLGLIDHTLYDGSFDKWMKVFEDNLNKVVEYSLLQAEHRYKALFNRNNTYTWYKPSDETYSQVIYELGNTYLGQISSDALGEVYERLLSRVDRQAKGQYYTPRNVIRAIWRLIDIDPLTELAETEGRPLRVFDFATGSGGFLVEVANHLRLRFENKAKKGAKESKQNFINQLAEGLVGAEKQRFPAYLAELNVLVQIGQLLQSEKNIRIPPLGILPTDALSLSNPTDLFEGEADFDAELLIPDEDRSHKASEVKDPWKDGKFFDVACGNPPYVGEKKIANILSSTREKFPYWNHFATRRMDYLYWFIILGISKLRKGGRFGFITTEYWLRATSASSLRDYIAQRCEIDRIILFRNLRLFPDAPGQHSMIITGTRTVEPDMLGHDLQDTPKKTRPRVSIYEGAAPSVQIHQKILEDLVRGGKSSQYVRNFSGACSPNELGSHSWGEVILSKPQRSKRRRLLERAKALYIYPEESMLSGTDRMRDNYADKLPVGVLNEIGWPDRKAGVFVLTREETDEFVDVTEQELKTFRTVINTKEVFPYAAVPPDDARILLYLPDPVEEKASRSLSEVRNWAFPEGMPNIKAHLKRFEPLLMDKVTRYGEKRPWWSVHRSKPDIVARDYGRDGWADYCITSRWGNGGKLVVGLAPQKSAPMSSAWVLHTEKGIPGAYACGILNSTPVQEMAATLPPGNLRAHDLRELGLPFIPDKVNIISDSAVELANIVYQLVLNQKMRFPRLPECLQNDIELGGVLDESWVPKEYPSSKSGFIRNVLWVKSLEPSGTQNTKIKGAETISDLFGIYVTAFGGKHSKLNIRLAVNDNSLINAVLALLRGAVVLGFLLKDLPDLIVPIESDELKKAYSSDRQNLQQLVDQYHELRKRIDNELETLL